MIPRATKAAHLEQPDGTVRTVANGRLETRRHFTLRPRARFQTFTLGGKPFIVRNARRCLFGNILDLVERIN